MSTRVFLGKALIASILIVGLAACVSDLEKKGAISAVNEGFRPEYDRIIASEGVRIVDAPAGEAFMAMRVAFASLGMRTESQDQAIGYLLVSGDAPLPLDEAGWDAASAMDLPLLQKLIKPHVGVAANFVEFEPEGLSVRVSATFVAKSESSTEVALTVRLQEKKPARSGWPRREYVSPNVLRAGLGRVWTAFDHELNSKPGMH